MYSSLATLEALSKENDKLSIFPRNLLRFIVNKKKKMNIEFYRLLDFAKLLTDCTTILVISFLQNSRASIDIITRFST